MPNVNRYIKNNIERPMVLRERPDLGIVDDIQKLNNSIILRTLKDKFPQEEITINVHHSDNKKKYFPGVVIVNDEFTYLYRTFIKDECIVIYHLKKSHEVSTKIGIHQNRKKKKSKKKLTYHQRKKAFLKK